MPDYWTLDVILVASGEMQLTDIGKGYTLRMKTISISSQARAMRYGISDSFRLVTTAITKSVKIVPTKHVDGASEPVGYLQTQAPSPSTDML